MSLGREEREGRIDFIIRRMQADESAKSEKERERGSRRMMRMRMDAVDTIDGKTGNGREQRRITLA